MSQSQLISNIASIANNNKIRSQAKRVDLNISNVTWEDCARYKNSCFGPNISDMTLQVNKQRLPLIRYENFNDKTIDTHLDKFNVTVGNESTNTPLKRISLKEYLTNASLYINSKVPSLYCEEKDTNILTSAQYCILPLSNDTVEFNVNLYNYQSYTSNPTVLVLVCSQKGTSAQTVFQGDTNLYFNNAGNACNYVAERLKDERKRLDKDIEGAMDADESERNTLFIFQIPLKVKQQERNYNIGCATSYLGYTGIKKSKGVYPTSSNSMSLQSYNIGNMPISMSMSFNESSRARGMDNAMLSVSKHHSKFEGVKDVIERDPQFPIRVTCQFYKVTDSVEIPDDTFTEMKERIDKIYKNDASSLVTEKTNRSTEWDKDANHNAKEFIKTLPLDEISNKPMINF